MKHFKHYFNAVLAAVVLLAGLPGTFMQISAADTLIWGIDAATIYDAGEKADAKNQKNQNTVAATYGVDTFNAVCYNNTDLFVSGDTTLNKKALQFNERRAMSLSTAATFQFTKTDKPNGTAPAAMNSGVYIVEIDFSNKVLNAANQVQYVLRGTDNAALATVELNNTAKQLVLNGGTGGSPLSIDATGSAAPGYLRLEADLTKHTLKAYAYAYANSSAIGTKPALEDCTLLGEVSFDAGAATLTALDVLQSNAETNDSNGKWSANLSNIYSVTVTKQEQQGGGEVTEVLPAALAKSVETQLDFEDNTNATKGTIVSADSGFTYAEGIHGKALILKTEATPRRISLGQYDFADKTLTFSMRSEAFGKAGYPVILGNNDSYTLPYSGFDLSYWGSNTDRFEMQCGDTAAGSKIKKNIQFKHSTEGPGDWINIAVAFNNTGKKATGYLNGEQCAEINTADLADKWMNGTGLNFHIGNDGTVAGCPDNAKNSFELWMDNFRIFDKVLTADEVKAINTADQKVKESHTVTVQSADESKGTVAIVTEGDAFEEGSSVTVRVTAKPGFTFSGWTAAGITLSAVQQGANPLIFTMPKADVTLTANFTAETPDDGTIKVGILSDTQLTAQYSDDRYARMKSMLQQFKNANVDVIMMPGDITDKAEAGAYDRFWATYREVYPAGEASPVFLPIMGNHDFWNGHFSGQPNDLAAALALYKEKMGLESENIAQKVKGYHFIGVSTDTDYNYDQETIDWLSAQLAAAAADTPDKPIFVMQHANVKGTVFTSDDWGNDQLTPVLNQYPQVVHFSGHAHFPLQDERSIYQENFTAIATSAIAYLELESGKEGGTKPTGYNKVGQGMIMNVATDKITIERLDAATGKKLAADWEILMPIRKENFTYTKDRAEKRTAPAFPQDATLEASAVTDKTARIKAPAATHDNFVYSYRVEVVNTDLNATVSNKLYFSDWWKDIESMAKTVTFDIDGLKAGTNYKVNLYAQESFSKESAPISVTFETEAKPQNAEMITFDMDEIYNAYKEVDPTIKADGTGANKELQPGWMKTGAGITVSTSLSYCYDNNFMKSASWTLGKMALLSNSRPGMGYCNPTKYDFTASTTINPNPTELSDGMFRLEMDLNNYMEAADTYLDYAIVGNGGDILKLRADRNSKTVSLRDAAGNLVGTAHTLVSEKAAPIYVRLDIDMVSKKINAWVGNYANVDEVGVAPALENCTQLVAGGSFLNDSALITGMDIWAQTAASGSLVSAIYGLKVSEVQIERPTYTLSAQSSDAAMGTVSIEPEEEAFLEGTSVTVTATPAADHLFTGWTAQGMTLTEEQKTQNPLTFSMPASAVTLTANFAFDTEISITPETATYDKYAQSAAHQNLVFTLKTSGKAVTAVKLDDTVLEETTDYTLSGKTLTVLTSTLDAQSGTVNLVVTIGDNTDVTAAVTITDTTPILVPHTVTVIPGTGGSASISGGQTAFKAGEEVTLTASANSGYAFSQWMSNDVTLTANGATATFIMPDKEVTVRAYFTRNQPSNNNTSSSGGGGGRGTGSGSSSAVVLPGGTNNNNNNNNQPPVADHLSSNYFNDITTQNTWAYGYIEHLAAAGIVSGDQNQNFNPKNNITREEFLKMLMGALDIDVTATNGGNFTDVGNGDWFAPYVGKACELGIVNGMGNGSFGIGQNITREDMAVMASRALAAANKTLPQTQQTALTDMAQVSGYAQSSVQQLTAAGVISGDENAAFRPLNNALREEAAKIVYLILAA